MNWLTDRHSHAQTVEGGVVLDRPGTASDAGITQVVDSVISMTEAARWPVADYQDDAGRKARQEPRLKLSCCVFFFGDDDFEGEGTLVDISTRGCRISSSIPVQPEMFFKLSLFLPDYNWPARVDEAIVRWVHGQDFEVEFTTIRPAMRERILMLMMKVKR